MAGASKGSTLKPAGDELTPELALVDPELAQRARERLPHAAESAHAAEEGLEPGPVVDRIPPAELVAAKPVQAEPIPTDVAGLPARRRLRRISRVVVASIAVVGAVGLGFALPPLLLEDRTGSPSASAPRVLPTTVGAADAEPAPTTSAAVPPAAMATEEEASSPDAASARGARNFGWVPVERASHYHVAFFRGKQKIFEAWPRRPPLVVQPRWTFKGRRFSLSPGQYRWVVRPGFGPRRAARYGEPAVDASLVIRR
jgi:hypothetical protein